MSLKSGFPDNIPHVLARVVEILEPDPGQRERQVAAVELLDPLRELIHHHEIRRLFGRDLNEARARIGTGLYPAEGLALLKELLERAKEDPGHR